MSNTSKSEKKGSHTGLVFLGGLVAAVAAAYYVSNSKSAQKKIKDAKTWAVKAKGDVLKKIKSMKNVDEELYYKAVDAVMKKYENVKNVDVKDLVAVSKEMKGHWKNIKKELQSTAQKAVKSATKVVKDAKKAVTK